MAPFLLVMFGTADMKRSLALPNCLLPCLLLSLVAASGCTDGAGSTAPSDDAGSESADSGSEGADSGPGSADAGTGSTDSGAGSDDAGVSPACGDGVVNGAEQCDDGVNDGGEGECLGCAGLQICGDGVLEGTEFCDDGAGNSSCPGFCSTDCSQIVPLFCGDGTLSPPEVCDQGPNNGAGPGFCELDCTGIAGDVCGDGFISGSEACDDGINNGAGIGFCLGDCSDILAAPSCADSELITFEITAGNLYSTPLQNGTPDQGLPGASVAPCGVPTFVGGNGQLVVRLDTASSQITLVSFSMPMNYQTGGGFIVPDVYTIVRVSVPEVTVGMDRRCPAAWGTLSGTTVTWDECTPHPDMAVASGSCSGRPCYSSVLDGIGSWRPGSSASGPGCLADWGAEGQRYCVGQTCELVAGFSGLTEGSNPVSRTDPDGVWNQPPLGTWTFGGPDASVGWTMDHTDLPNDSNIRTYLSITDATEISRATVPTPSCACPAARP